MPSYVDVAAFNFICGTKFKSQALSNLSIAFLRQSNSAARQYERGRIDLQHYAVAREASSHALNSYLFAVEGFEQCLNAIGKAIELENEMRSLLSIVNDIDSRVFQKNDGSVYNRIVDLNNRAKHWNAEQATTNLSAPLWITNEGLSSEVASLSFLELRQSVIDLNEQCRLKFVELPAQARARK